MSLNELLTQHRDAIAKAWLDAALGVYPGDAVRLFGREKDRFANPVGRTLATETEALLDGLCGEMDAEALCGPLERIVRIRAVQELAPSRALAFIFDLKSVVRKVLGSGGGPKAPKEERIGEDLLAFDARVDQLALFGFDIFVKCREQIYELRVGEVKRSIHRLLQRAEFIVGSESPAPEP